MSQRILIVEDHEDSRHIFSLLLSKEGYEVFHAKNGLEGLQKMDAFRPDLVLLDIIIPKVNGFEVCRRIKTDPSSCAVPVLIITACTDSASREKSLHVGADAFLCKPIVPRDLLMKIRDCFRPPSPSLAAL